MFDRAAVQNPGRVDGGLDIGRILEAMLYYSHVDFVVDARSFTQLWFHLGPTGTCELLTHPSLSVRITPEMPAVLNNTRNFVRTHRATTITAGGRDGALIAPGDASRALHHLINNRQETSLAEVRDVVRRFPSTTFAKLMSEVPVKGDLFEDLITDSASMRIFLRAFARSNGLQVNESMLAQLEVEVTKLNGEYFIANNIPFEAIMSPAQDIDGWDQILPFVQDYSYDLHLAQARSADLIASDVNATASSATWEQANIQGHLIQALLKCLEHDPSRSGYVAELMSLADRGNAIIASLNYDLLVEDVLTKADQSYDYGLSAWNEKKLVSFANSRGDLRLLKLHGSMNWYPANDDTILVGPERPLSVAPMMVFGGASGKLRADGPFLQLRHEFERQLLNTNVFVIVGYAFGDNHLNAIIRRWVSTRRKAKMIFVNPAAIEFTPDMIGFPYKLSKDRSVEARTVDLTHIKKKTAAAIADIKDELDRPIDLSVSRNPENYRGPFRIVQ